MRAKARKPLFFDHPRLDVQVLDDPSGVMVAIEYEGVTLTAAEARRLAAWLIRAAEWIEGREGR